MIDVLPPGYERVTVDATELFIGLMVPELPGVTIREAIDVDSIGDRGIYLPLLTMRAYSGDPIKNGNYRMGWRWLFLTTLLGEGKVETAKVADWVYDVIMKLPGRVLEDVGSVSSIEGRAMFTRTATSAVLAQQVWQYDASFTACIRPPKRVE